MSERGFGTREIPEFDRSFVGSNVELTRIGGGEVGGKAQGLFFVRDLLESALEPGSFPGVETCVPRFTVLGTDVFDAFIERNGLHDIAFSDLPDDRIANAFQRSQLPAEIVGDLKALMDEVQQPLAVRSSSLLEDALFRPFAGVYETKMTPNNQPDPAARFRKLVEAIKFVYASTYFRSARNYIRATDRSIQDEKMAVIIQEVVGRRHGDRFYPELSGVCRSHDFYPGPHSRREDGVVNLALGLGKTIVEGDCTWTYSPGRPKAPPPFESVTDTIRNTQSAFWAVNMGRPPAFDPIRETEYLVRLDLSAAEYDGTLAFVASTHDVDSDRLVPGVNRPGARALTFAPLLELETYPLNRLIRTMLTACERSLNVNVEIEFAMTLPGFRGNENARLGFLQLRPMVVSDEEVTLTEGDVRGANVLVTSSHVMGNGTDDSIRDIVYVKPESFEARCTRLIAREFEEINAELLTAGRPYLLIGFGRWGSSDPWLGIPVNWGDICGAKVIVESTLPDMIVELSQGSHFFHNISSFHVSYFSVRHQTVPGIDWNWLDAQPAASEMTYLRHVRLNEPLKVKVDGRTGSGVIWHGN